MTNVEDDADFGSHFLDSMLEVEMTEEDNELDVSKNDDPLETLPPVPTFDLQSETYPYKDVYRSTIPQPVLASLPIGTSNACNVPLVIKPSSMLIYSGGVAPPQPPPVLTAVQKILPKTVAKNPTKNVNISVNVNNSSDVGRKFVDDVFKMEFVNNVFVKADPPWDISLVSEEEMKYYKTCFKDVSKVQNCRIHCTICDKHLGCGVTAEKKINVHSMLKVLTCKPCFQFYGDGNFPCDKGDNCEIYCRWCGQGGALICCSFCPSVFCKRCVRRNYGPLFLKKIEKASDWACFCCAQKPLWPHRAICRALLEFLAKKKTDPKATVRDTTTCCKMNRRRGRAPADKTKLGISQPQSSQPKTNSPASLPNSKSKTVTPLKTRKEQLMLKPVVQLKPSDRIKVPISSNKNSKTGGVTNVFSPRSLFTGNSIIRGITSNAPAKLISTFPAPHLIQSPVIHGETLITPPSRLLIPAKTPPNPTPNVPYVRVSLTHQTPNLDVNKIPTVKIPHEVHGLILRLIFPDNKMHYVRLASDGSGCKASKEFPMPQFREKGASFLEKNLAEAFQISKTMYDELQKLREKVDSRTKFTEESVFNSSVKKLHLKYEKTIELLKNIDKTLLEKHEEWKKGTKHSVDVIDISDDESSATKKNKSRNANGKEKSKKPNEDSDIEILDDVTVNGKTPSNYKEKYRLRRSTEIVKTPATHTVGVRKRKRGRVRRNNKRLKTMKMENGQPEEDPLRTDDIEPEEQISPDLEKTSFVADLQTCLGEEEELESEQINSRNVEVNGGDDDASEVDTGMEGVT